MNKYLINKKHIVRSSSVMEAVKEYIDTNLKSVWCIKLIVDKDKSNEKY